MDSSHHTASNLKAYSLWRRIHLISSGALLLIAMVHSGLTAVFYSSWSPNAVWFLGTGMSLLLLSALNLSHIGIEPCRDPTTRLVRWSNWIFLLFGIGASIAVPEPQAYAIVVCLAGQAVAARWTLPGPANEVIETDPKAAE